MRDEASVTEFEHLHVHTQYSLLESAARVKDLCARAKESKSRVVAMTDHGNLHGVIDLYKKSKDAGVRPAFGCELAFALPPDVAKLVPDKAAARAHYHLVLLARNKVGFGNLVELVSEAWLTGGDAPRATLDMLAAHAPGLMVLSGCLGGIAPQAVLWGAPAGGRLALAALRAATEPGQLFVELQDHGLREQGVVNGVLAGLARELDLPLVATNDVHYVAPGDAVAHRLLGCIASGTTLDESDRTFHHAEQMWLKPPEAMAATGLGAYPDALRNTLEVASRVEAIDPTAKPMLPKFRDAAGRVIDDEAGYFTRLCWEGLARRIAQLRARGAAIDEPVYRARLEFEVAMIVRMGFPGYFLIVQDFINWAKSNGVPVGPGRGSGAGSLAAYSLGITDLDPIALNLLFERFLNPDRVSMPDFDIDFCQFRRDRVIEYVRGKYGAHAVGQIATFQMLKSKSVVRDVGRAMGFPIRDVDAVARLIPDPVMGRAVSISEALAQVPELAALHAAQPATRELLGRAQQVENLNRHAGTHAAGVVLSDGPLWQRVPVFRGTNGELVTQYAMEAVELAGLVKFDFLGLTTLSVIDFTRQLVDQRPDRAGLPPFDIGAIPMDDAPTFALLQTGLTAGVFQLESTGMQKLFRDLHPDRFEDIVAAVALYRPGPLGAGMVQDFVARKNGRAPIEHLHGNLADVLEPTYGVITYQEQVMMVARRIAGYTLGAADLLRRAMGKKKPEEMAKHRATFLEGAQKNGHSEEFATKLFDMLSYFADYGFNRCVHADTLVANPVTGELVRIADIATRRDFHVYAMNSRGWLEARRVLSVIGNGVRQVFRLVTRLAGREILATANHPFFTPHGWTRLDHLRPGDAVMVATIETGSATDDVAWDTDQRLGFDVVSAIDPAGDAETFDLTVEEDHNFVANGIVVHNSHSAAYALLTYQTAYLKTHYPVEFLVGTLTADLGKADKVLGTIVEARRMGVAVLPPDVDESAQAFTVVYPTDGSPPRIRFGLGGMKGVGDVAVAAILEARASGPFIDLFDFCARVDPGRATQPVLETLLSAGAFDTLLRRAGVSRAQGFAALPSARARGKSAAQERRGAQERLFALEAVLGPTEYPEAAPWDVSEVLRRERAALGFYLSAHPLDRYDSDMERPVGALTTAIPEFADGEDVMIAGVLEDVREIVTQHKAKMAFAQLEDRQGRCEVILRPKIYAAMREAGIAAPGSAVYVFGRVQIDRRAAEEAGDDAPTADLPRNIAADRVLPLGEALRERARGVVLRLPSADRGHLRGVRAILEAYPGGHPVVAVTRGDDGRETVLARSELRVDGSDAMLAAIEKEMADGVARGPADAHGITPR